MAELTTPEYIRARQEHLDRLDREHAAAKSREAQIEELLTGEITDEQIALQRALIEVLRTQGAIVLAQQTIARQLADWWEVQVRELRRREPDQDDSP